MPFLKANGAELFYRVYGSGPPVVFAHGGGGTHTCWFQQIPHFSKRYQCIVIDQRGFGLSTDPENEGSSRFVDDLEALLGHLGIEKTALVAQSMGGTTCLGFAVRHPERVSALVMCDTRGSADWPELQARYAVLVADAIERTKKLMTIEQRMGEQVEPGSVEAESAEILARTYHPTYPERNPAMALLYTQNFIAQRRPSDTGRPTMRAAAVIGKEEVAALRMPSLFVVGDQDWRAFPEIMREIANLIPGSEFVEVPNCGHSVYWEDPETFNKVVDGFLSKHLLVSGAAESAGVRT